MYVTPQIDSLTEEGSKKSRPMRKSSVVMAVSGAVGLPAILMCDACIHDGFVGFRELSNELLPIYFYFHLKARRLVSRGEAAGAIWQNITTDQINAWSIPVPPRHMQERFVSLVSLYGKLDGNLREALRQAEHLFKSLLHQAFTVGI
jgi:hypothetical protein